MDYTASGDVRENVMAKQHGYRNGRRAQDGMFQPDIRQDVNDMLDIYCRINDINKTRLVNDILRDWLLDKFVVLREE